MTSTSLAGRRVLVTGGSGFIGRHLIDRLAGDRVQLFATSRTPVPSSDAAVSWLALDLADTESIRTAVRAARPDVVFHLAARLGAERTLEFSETALRENVLGTHSFLAALHEQNPAIDRIVVAGSGEEYGRCDTLPITEETPLRPVSPYSLSKAAASQLALTYASLFGMPVTVVRPFVVYGPEQSPAMMLPTLIRTLVSEGEFAMTAGAQTRDFVYVDDVVDGLLAAASSKHAVGEAFNLCSGEERSILDVAELAQSLAGQGVLRAGAIPYRENEAWRLYGSNEKAERLLEWKPRTTLEHGLEKTIEWYRQEHNKRS
jgi:UDP-glucose 4-epimerase